MTAMSSGFPLSIVCVFRNQKEDAETTLTLLLERVAMPHELIVIDDGSEDGTGEAIASVLEHFQPEAAVFLHNEEPRGTAVCVNEALAHITAPVLWLPGVLSDFDADGLAAAVSELVRAEAPFAVCGAEVPIRPDRWVEAIMDNTLPADAAFLVRLDRIVSTQRFVNPFLTRALVPEWVIRCDAAGILRVCSQSPCTTGQPYLSDAEKNELLLALVRSGRWKLADILESYKTLRASSTVRLAGETATIERLLRDGEVQTALEAVNGLLAAEPDRADALNLKIKILEKLRKYVEAAEIKRRLRAGDPASVPVKKAPILVVDPSEDPGEIEVSVPLSDVGVQQDEMEIPTSENSPPKTEISIVVLTTTDRQPLLERLLGTVYRHANQPGRELILVDNGSVDDTGAYLDQLEAEPFMPTRCIRNDSNRGFAAGVNQALAIAAGRTIVVLHNDVVLFDDVPGKLHAALDAHPDAWAAGAMADRCRNDVQAATMGTDRAPFPAQYLDSFAFALRAAHDLRFDESFGPAWFEDAALGAEIRARGGQNLVVPAAFVRHDMGLTTGDLGIGFDSPRYWANEERYRTRYGDPATWQVDASITKPEERLVAMGFVLNPYHPQPDLVAEAEELLTSETRTALLHREWKRPSLKAILRLLGALDLRDLMRSLEDKLFDMEPDAALVEWLMRFYADHLIYSRVRMYYEALTSDDRTLEMQWLMGRIAMADKELDTAADWAVRLHAACPVHPGILNLAADVHQAYGRADDAEAFRAMARQLHPF